MSKWAGVDGEIGQYVRAESQRTLEAYRAQPNLVDEQANQEQDTARGGYADRQIVELVQNSADQLAKLVSGRVYIRLTESHLYCADDGAPLNQDGAKALLFSHLSPKRDTAEIGRFGVGFKSVLRVTDKPAVFSRSGSIQFDRRRAKRSIAAVAPDADDYPVLRVAEPADATSAAKSDPALAELMGWARNVVRLPLRQGAFDNLAKQIDAFAPEFLLFAPHIRSLDLVDDSGRSRSIRRIGAGGQIQLSDGESRSRWMVFTEIHPLSADAKADSRALDDAQSVHIQWAAPLDARNPLQQFWAFFPTQTSSLVAGILNAPWKTNEDRQSLLPGVYNDELIGAAAQLVADSLPSLPTPEDPARHLDALPRRAEAGDNDQADLLRRRLYGRLEDAPIIPDQDGVLRRIRDLQIPPAELTPGQRVESAPLDRWRAYEHHPTDWLHHNALTSDRLAAIGRIYDGGRSDRGYRPRTSIAEWLTALTEAGARVGDEVQASMAALQTAALIPEASRQNKDLGSIALTGNGKWAPLDPDSIYLNGDDPSVSIHPSLQADSETLKALRELGIRAPSVDSRLRNLAVGLAAARGDVDKDPRWRDFWRYARDCGDDVALRVIDQTFPSRAKVRVLTENSTWEPIFEVLMPGTIVSSGDSPAYVVVDTKFHTVDRNLFSELGVVAEPYGEAPLIGDTYQNYLAMRRQEFRKKSNGQPQLSYLTFDTKLSSGPLDVFRYLSDDSKVRFTEALFDLDATYVWLTMRHVTREQYKPVRFVSPAVRSLRQYGEVMIGDEQFSIADGLGDTPKNREVQRWLLEHPKTRRIREVFHDLRVVHDGEVEVVGDDEPIPLLDVWPGLAMHIKPEDQHLQLTRCDRILDAATGDVVLFDCVQRGNALFVVWKDDERAELAAVVTHLKLEIDEQVLDAILRRDTPADIEAAMARVREQTTDAARLLTAVGEKNLLAGLPAALVGLLAGDTPAFTELEVAKAAIATFHSGALREYRHTIGHLDPPKMWAGGRRALEFVASLGFGPEWAGRPSPKRSPFVDVPGPRSLPDLHDYQETIVGNVRVMFRREHPSGENRGLLSMPTGSGKTRVAVQALIEAIRDDDFGGTVLWVADRDELCEQAVEVWQQAWASIGPEAAPLRVSRWWAGQRTPQAPGGHHVIVATIQTLRARIERGSSAADVLGDVTALVVDEAHGSIAPSYTQLMSELGLTFRRTDDEIALLGLTATPYRGLDATETERLVRRYGSNRLDFGAFGSDDPEKVIRQLQEMTVLTEVDHKVIGGTTVQLTAAEKVQAEDRPWLPDSVEERLAADANRTKAIIRAYKTQVRSIGANVPTLIFATSVAHAETIAAVLSLDGVAARAVSGNTETSVRRSIVEQFRAGEIDVLVNYGVFREGFDAPKTRAIIVARPVYSPNLYFQMIGRGLRGELNGGSDRCLILDVEDNIQNFDRALAFSELDWLWAESRDAQIARTRL